jgi:hypothetical protein
VPGPTPRQDLVPRVRRVSEGPTGSERRSAFLRGPDPFLEEASVVIANGYLRMSPRPAQSGGRLGVRLAEPRRVTDLRRGAHGPLIIESLPCA